MHVGSHLQLQAITFCVCHCALTVVLSVVPAVITIVLFRGCSPAWASLTVSYADMFMGVHSRLRVAWVWQMEPMEC